METGRIGKHSKPKKKPAPVEPSTEPKIGEMRVWHIPQVPMQPFYVPIISSNQELAVAAAKTILSVLWDYDAFQFEHNIKPDYSNASGLEVYVKDNGDGKPGWTDWESEEGESISGLMRRVQ